MMKSPRYVITSMQDAGDVGINPFALQLLAESFADDPAKFGDANVLFLAQSHNGQKVWFVMTKTQPQVGDFAASPDMLAALKIAEAFITEELETRKGSFLPGPTEGDSEYIGAAQSALDAVSAAIAKAGPK